jgi:hypothetical protein
LFTVEATQSQQRTRNCLSEITLKISGTHVRRINNKDSSLNILKISSVNFHDVAASSGLSRILVKNFSHLGEYFPVDNADFSGMFQRK